VQEVRDIAKRLQMMPAPAKAPKPGDTVFGYHGTPYTGSEPLRRGSTGFWVATDRRDSESYARGGRILSMKVDTTGFADLTRDKKLAQKLIDTFNAEPSVIEEGRELDGTEELYAVFSGDEAEPMLRELG
jgi:hypothetical protein